VGRIRQDTMTELRKPTKPNANPLDRRRCSTAQQTWACAPE